MMAYRQRVAHHCAFQPQCDLLQMDFAALLPNRLPVFWLFFFVAGEGLSVCVHVCLWEALL
jgi:hypothetical protein